MTAPRDLAERLIARRGVTIQWTRRELVSGGASGVVTEVSAPVTHQVVAVQTSQQAFRTTAEWWLASDIQIIVAASGLPFDPEVSGQPEAQWSDTVVWGGRSYRVSGMSAWHSPNAETREPEPYMYFVGLVA